MYICQWHLDIPFGKQSEVIKIMKAWHKDGEKLSEFKRSKQNRLLVGHVGESASHIVAEHMFESLEDFEAAISSMGDPQFKKHAEDLAPYVASGSQQWKIFRVVE